MEFAPIKDKPNFRWCLSPTCDSGQLHEYGEKDPKITCMKCSFDTCFTCQTPWHKEKTCEEFNVGGKSDEDTKASKGEILKSSVPCPKCGVPVIKNGGCPNVSCE